MGVMVLRGEVDSFGFGSVSRAIKKHFRQVYSLFIVPVDVAVGTSTGLLRLYRGTSFVKWPSAVFNICVQIGFVHKITAWLNVSQISQGCVRLNRSATVVLSTVLRTGYCVMFIKALLVKEYIDLANGKSKSSLIMTNNSQLLYQHYQLLSTSEQQVFLEILIILSDCLLCHQCGNI